MAFLAVFVVNFRHLLPRVDGSPLCPRAQASQKSAESLREAAATSPRVQLVRGLRPMKAARSAMKSGRSEQDPRGADIPRRDGVLGTSCGRYG